MSMTHPKTARLGLDPHALRDMPRPSASRPNPRRVPASPDGQPCTQPEHRLQLLIAAAQLPSAVPKIFVTRSASEESRVGSKT